MAKTQRAEKLTILVEGATDKDIVRHFLTALHSDAENRVAILACDGKLGVKREFHRRMAVHGRFIALIDADAPSVPDSVAWAQEFLDTSAKNVFCAVPNIEAWIFADKKLALAHSRMTSYAVSAISRIVTPESLMNPKHLVNQVFDKDVIRGNFPFLSKADIGRAVASSISLFNFLQGVEAALKHHWTFVEQKLSNSLNRTVFANLLREIPAETIGWRTLDGEYTAEQLGDLILQGDERGLRYISDLLRLARDILAARADIRGSDDA